MSAQRVMEKEEPMGMSRIPIGTTPEKSPNAVPAVVPGGNGSTRMKRMRMAQ